MQKKWCIFVKSWHFLKKEVKCFFTKGEEMSRVGSRDRHAWWRSKKLKASQTRLFFIRWLVCALFSYFCSSLCILCVRRIALMKERQCTKLCKMFEEESRYNRDKLKITSHLWWQYLKANWRNHIFDRFYVNLVVYVYTYFHCKKQIYILFLPHQVSGLLICLVFSKMW